MWRPLSALILGTMMSACTASSPVPALVEIRSGATADPVEGALICTEGLTLFAPVSHEGMGLGPGATVGPLPDPVGARTRTDAAGRRALMLAGNRPNTLIVTAEGFAPIRVLVETNATSVRSPIGWTTGPTSAPDRVDHDAGHLQVRVTTLGATGDTIIPGVPH